MPVPTREALLTWAKGYVELWNSGDKEAWVANWKKVAPGDLVMVDPVGTPPKHGFDGCCSEPYEPRITGNPSFRLLQRSN